MTNVTLKILLHCGAWVIQRLTDWCCGAEQPRAEHAQD